MKHVLSRRYRRLCKRCGQRGAKFSYRGVVKVDRFHELCFRCFRSVTDATRARRLAA